MNNLQIPENYHSPLTIRETEVAIKEVKDHFERALAKSLHLTRVSAPLFVRPESGLNDNLNGVERPVAFGIKEQEDREVEIVHSLAKWKRYALKRYGFHSGEGLYTCLLFRYSSMEMTSCVLIFFSFCISCYLLSTVFSSVCLLV